MAPKLDHEKLDVYQLELEFLAWVSNLLDEVSDSANRRLREIVSQLDRASLSILLNTAEGNGRRQKRARAKFFDDARGSATECSACLDALVARRVCEEERILNGKGLLVRIVSMLTKLVAIFGGDDRIAEDRPIYGLSTDSSLEYEDEDKDEKIAS